MLFSGLGLHTGEQCTLTLASAKTEGLCFVIKSHPVFCLKPELAEGQPKGTVIHSPNGDLTTVEHVLSACAGTGHWNVTIKMSACEPPIMDGSALPFVDLLAGIPKNSVEPFVLKFPVAVQEKDSFIVALPVQTPRLPVSQSPSQLSRIRYYASYPHTGDLYYDFDGTAESYLRDIAPARTFCMDYEIDIQRKAGLIKGATPDCGIVFSPDGPSLPLRFPDEPVRHKILDLIGDLAILGRPLQAEIVAVKTSHRLNIAFAKKLAETLKNQT